MSHNIAEERFIPINRGGNSLGVRVDQQFIGIVTDAVEGVISTMGAITVQLPGLAFTLKRILMGLPTMLLLPMTAADIPLVSIL